MSGRHFPSAHSALASTSRAVPRSQAVLHQPSRFPRNANRLLEEILANTRAPRIGACSPRRTRADKHLQLAIVLRVCRFRPATPRVVAARRDVGCPTRLTDLARGLLRGDPGEASLTAGVSRRRPRLLIVDLRRKKIAARTLRPCLRTPDSHRAGQPARGRTGAGSTWPSDPGWICHR
jgi:hypothetical protein